MPKYVLRWVARVPQQGDITVEAGEYHIDLAEDDEDATAEAKIAWEKILGEHPDRVFKFVSFGEERALDWKPST